MALRVDLLTREYPPEVYGGAGVHVEYLVHSLRPHAQVRVHCFGAPRSEPDVIAYAEPPGLDGANPALRTVGVDLEMAAGCAGTDLVHSHTWYANLAGHTAKLLYGVPHVMTAHSLEPLRPWKAEQLGGGYALSSWCERTAVEAADAVIAVSTGMMRDVLAAYPDVDPGKVHVVHNGIDTTQYAPDHRTDVLRRLGIDPDRPSVVYVGRITRQKGLVYLLRAAESLPAGVQLVLLAGAPDTPEIAREVEELAGELSRSRGDVVWVEQMLPRPEVIQVLTHATVFVCPSIYEPMGIVNLEAMACETAVVATATGGIPEVVADGSTGLLVPIAQAADGSGTPLDPARFVADLAAAIADVLAGPDRARAMGQAGRQRAVEHFSWSAIAQRTLAVYQSVLPRPRRRRAAGADATAAGAKTTGAKTTGAKTTGAKTTGAKTTGAKTTGARTTGAKATGGRAAGTKATSAKAAGTKAAATKGTATKAAGTTAAGPRRRPAQPRTPR